MATAARDRSARSRIREFLTQHGPVEDSSGRATALLKDAVGYRGNDVAFIQLVTAMDKAAEIRREIRGKRTYKISATVPARVPRTAAPVAGEPGAAVVIDYDALARAVVQELARVLAGQAAAESAGGLDAVRLERDRLQAERDEYAKRLQVARRQLTALLAQSTPDDGILEQPAAGGARPDRVQQAS
jgi:hypothetical protein